MALQSPIPAINRFQPCLAVIFHVGKASAPRARRGHFFQPEKLVCLWTSEINVTAQLASRYSCSPEQGISYYGTVVFRIPSAVGQYQIAHQTKEQLQRTQAPFIPFLFFAHGYMVSSRKRKMKLKGGVQPTAHHSEVANFLVFHVSPILPVPLQTPADQLAMCFLQKMHNRLLLGFMGLSNMAISRA